MPAAVEAPEAAVLSAYGLLLNTEDAPGRRRTGTGAWAGLVKTHFFIDRTTGILCLDQHELAALITWDEAGKPYSDVEEAPLLRRYGRVARPDFPHCLAARPPPRGTQLELLTASPTEELTSSVHGK